MQISSVRLKNFKIHEDAYFEFQPGINAICGENGAGKTSILEAIAWVLFDHCDYTLEELVRVGANSAEVGVQFVSDVDQRTYEVRRTITGKSGYFRVYDPATHQQLDYEKKEDVQRWLQHHLGVSPDTDLKHLFRTAIGVPQGTFTVDFLKTPSERKKVFDAMIKIEDYKATAEQLKELEKYSQEQITSTGHRIELLQVELKNRDPWLEQQRTVTETLTQQRQHLHQLHQALAELDTEWQTLEAQHQQLAILQQHGQTLTSQVALAELALEQAARQRQDVETALHTLNTLQPSYESYLQAEEQWASLHSQWQERQRLQQEQETLRAAERTLEQDLTRITLTWERWQQLEAELVILAERVEQQTHLEQTLTTVQAERQALEQQHRQHELLLTQRQGLHHQATQVQQALHNALQAESQQRASQPGYETYRQAEKALLTVQEHLRQRDPWLQEWQRQREHLADLHQQQARWQEVWRRRQELLTLMDSLAQHIPQQLKLEHRIQELRERLQHLDLLRQRRHDLEQQAQQLAQDLESVEQEILNRQALLPQVQAIATLEAQQERLRQHLSRLAAAQQFQQELQALATETQHQQHTLRRTPAEVTALLERFPLVRQWLEELDSTSTKLATRLEIILRDLADQTDGPSLEQQWQSLQQRLQLAYEQRRHTDTLPEWQSRQQHLHQQHLQIQEALDEVQWQLDSDSSDRQHLDECLVQLQSLGDPRSYQQRCQQELDATQEAEATYHTLQEQIAQVQGSLTRLDQQLASLQELEAQRQHWQHQLTCTQPDYHTYLSQQTLAATRPEQEQRWQELTQALQSLDTQITTLEQHPRWGSLPTLHQQDEALQQQIKALGDPRFQVQRIQSELAERPRLAQQWQQLMHQQEQLRQQRHTLEAQLQQTAHLEAVMTESQATLSCLRPDYERYLQVQPLAAQHSQIIAHWQQAQHQATALRQEQQQHQQTYDTLLSQFDAERHRTIQGSRQELALTMARLETSVQGLEPQLAHLETQLAHLDTLASECIGLEQALAAQKRLHKFIKYGRGLFRDAGPRLAALYLESINHVADQLFREIMNRPDVSLTWQPDYDIVVQEGASRKRFALLSGGEQMIAALAVRLALLKTIEDVSVAFFDEPTTNMDRQRRTNLAESISQIKSFQQLFVISHDDSFENITGHIIHVER
ncbi:MAG: hypothetical protein OHK0012_12270 [Synechococcales cyanobacterium]